MIRGARRVATIAVGLVALALPALAAGTAQTSTGTASFAAGGTITAAPATTTTGTDAGAGSTAAAPRVAATGADDVAEATSREAATTGGAAVAADESGSTETETVQRACDAPEDTHYEPSSGRDAAECYDADGNFQPGSTYTATHFTNDVSCGSDNLLVPVDAAGAYVSGNGGGGADGGSGYLQACSEGDLPINGRATVRGDVDASGDFTTSATADGDRDNPEETSQGWATVTVTPAGPTHRCGKSYAEGGRADSDHPTSEDTADQCG